MRAALDRWHALAPRVRWMLACGAAAVCFALTFVAFAQRDARVTLFATPLDGSQISEVAERLAEWNVPFVATTDNVRVEASVRNDVLLRLSVAGIPHEHVVSTSDALAKAGPLTPAAVLEAQQRTGLAGDIASGLRGLAAIADARVIIAPAQPGTYADENGHDATASVRLSLRTGATLDRSVVAGIRQYVAAAVPGLKPARVALLDDRGSTLGEDAASDAAAEGTALAASLQSALDLAFGTGAAIVRAHVAYDSRSHDVRDVLRKPLGSRPIVQSTGDEHYASSSKQYSKNSGSLERGSDVRDEHIETPAGRLERISVAVAVDRARRLDLAKIRSLATGTLGLLSSRGDTLSIEEVAFAPAPRAAGAAAWMLALGSIAALVPSLAFAAAVVLGVRFGARPFAAIIESACARFALGRTARSAIGYAPAAVRGVLRGEPPHTAAAIISALPAATATAVLELYPAEERAAIVRRMARAATPAMPDYETVLRRG